MAHQTSFRRREIYRVPAARQSYLVVRRSQVRRVLRALRDLYRR